MRIRNVELPPPPATSDNSKWVRHCLELLDGKIKRREAKVARYTQELESLTAVRDLFLQLQGNTPSNLFDLIDTQTLGVSPDGLAPTAETGYSRRINIPEDIDLTRLEAVAGFHDTHDLRERLILIAKAAPDKFLNTTQVARALQRLGDPTPRLHTLRVSIQRIFDASPENFVPVRPATYRYTDYPGTHDDLGKEVRA